VGGPLGLDPAAVRPARAVPVLHIHGTADRFAPFAGGPGEGLSQTDFRSVDESVATWVALDGCPREARTIALPDTESDGMQSTRTSWGPGRDDSEVVLVTVEGGGHTWPGVRSRLELLGPSTLDFSANELMWEFFERHPMP
jgi:polyhydroxybutyrate depolymerase